MPGCRRNENMFPKSMTVREIAVQIEAKIEGDETLEVRSLASMELAGPADITFASDIKRIARLGESNARVVIISADAELPAGVSEKTYLRVNNVDRAIATLLGFLAGPESVTLPAVGIAPSALIDPDAELAGDVAIGPNVVIGPGVEIGQGTVLCAGVKIGMNVKIGAGCVFHEGVVIRHSCQIGKGVRIGPNSVVGADGFGYFFSAGVHNKIPHAGNVVLEDDVELGACVCVDRAKWGSTRIGTGSKIDNLCQVGHNVQMGQGCLLAGQAGIAGSTKLGRYVVLGGAVSIKDNIEIGDGAIVGATSGVAKSIDPGQTVFGFVAKDAKTFMRELYATAKLPDLLQQVKKLEKRIKELEDSRNS